jgi:EpsI family protein
VLYYRNQERDKSLISSVNRVAAFKDAWHEIDGASRTEALGNRPVALRETLLEGPQGKILVWRFNRVGDGYTASDVKGKLMLAASKAMLRGDDGAAVLLSAPAEHADAARAALRSFLQEQGPALDTALAAARSR